MLLHITFAGTVQGVGFRYFVRRKAKEIGINGWVRNNPDGTVEVMAEGEEDKLREFLNSIENGPPLAEVTHMAFEFIDKKGGFKDFEIQY